MGLVELIYKAAARFPKEEVYGLTNQLGRASVSAPSNIAEGQGRGSANDFRRFLAVSYGSLREVETQMLIARRPHLLSDAQAERVMSLAGGVGRLIDGPGHSLEGK